MRSNKQEKAIGKTKRWGKEAVAAFIHTILIFIDFSSTIPSAAVMLPWFRVALLSEYINLDTSLH